MPANGFCEACNPRKLPRCRAALKVLHFDVLGSRDSLATDLMFLNGALPPDVKVTSIQASPSGGFVVHKL
jgi:hypothetical protein